MIPLLHGSPSSCKGVPNAYDQCLSDAMVGQKATLDNVQADKERRWRFGHPPWVAMPRSGQRYQRVQSVVLPGVEGVDNLLLSYRVPFGYDGVLITITALFTGTGFIEGSGDLVWRVQNNFRYFKDLGAIELSLGDLQFPYSLEGGGYRLYSNDLIRMSVNLGAGSLGRLDPNGRIVVGITGWIYPVSIYKQR